MAKRFTATGGTAPYSWSISVGTPPTGIVMNTNGNFVGIPTTVGTFNDFTILVADANNNTATGNFSLSIAPASGYDGPAELPIATVASSMADTPAPGGVIKVDAGDNLQAALNNAQCGNTIELQAGATFTGNFVFPARNCDSDNWIIVRTSAPDSSCRPRDSALRPAMRESVPCRAVRVPLQQSAECAGQTHSFCRVERLVVFKSGANHYRLLGLEITRPTGTKGAPGLISVSAGGTASYIVLDRSWVHGTTQDETQVGFGLSGTNNVAIVDPISATFTARRSRVRVRKHTR